MFFCIALGHRGALRILHRKVDARHPRVRPGFRDQPSRANQFVRIAQRFLLNIGVGTHKFGLNNCSGGMSDDPKRI